LHHLAEPEEEQQFKKRADSSGEYPSGQKKQAKGIDQRGTDDQECIRRGRRVLQIRIESRCEIVKPVANPGVWQVTSADQGLRPEPDSDCDRRYDQAQEESMPRIGCHRQNFRITEAGVAPGISSMANRLKGQFARAAQIQLASA
jgi:hypothetical protein